MKKLSLAIATALLPFAVITPAQAEVVWQDFSVTGLYGENYKLSPKEEQSTVTFEYAAKVKYGDFFAFVDRAESGDVKSTYGEVSPRLSLSETFKTPLKFGIVKDVLLSSTWEAGGNFNNYLYGVGVDLAIPKFQYASLNFYRANNENIDDDWQITATYGVPFTLANQDFLYDGFIDWSTKENDHASELNWTSQLKWNAGKYISPKTRLYLGVEYSHWNNKYGVRNANQRDVSALVKYHF